MKIQVFYRGETMRSSFFPHYNPTHFEHECTGDNLAFWVKAVKSCGSEHEKKEQRTWPDAEMRLAVP